MTLDPLISTPGTSEKPLLCFEVNPPRGVDPAAIFTRLEPAAGQIDYFNVTDSALARMKCAPLPFASMLKNKFGIEPLVNLSCRDRNLIALQGDLLAGWMLGVRSVIALTGDAVTIGDFPECKGVFEVNSLGLLATISKLNAGADMVGNTLRGAPSLVPGVVVNPNARNPRAEIRRLKKKVDAGARYGLSQPVFDPELAETFFREAGDAGIPLLVGLLPFRSSQSARGIAAIPGIRLSPEIEQYLSEEGDRDLSDFSVHHCMEVAARCAPFVRGFHVIAGATPKLSLRLLKELAYRWK